MKFIDNQGKLFGKINIVDLAFILLVFSIITPLAVKLAKLNLSPFYFKDTFSLKPKKTKVITSVVEKAAEVIIPRKIEKISLTLKVSFGGYHKQIVKAIKPGDKDKHEPTTKVLRVNSIKRFSGRDASGRRIPAGLREAVLDVFIVAQTDGEKLFYKEKDLKLGENFLLSTVNYNINGIIIGISR